ncbi:hypothetical protein B0G69_1325 [Paraburkholderia sp. RAU2J]|nr:hypothetical protein B0G69_1325 [Paraburkholderia sp. RAU2J]
MRSSSIQYVMNHESLLALYQQGWLPHFSDARISWTVLRVDTGGYSRMQAARRYRPRITSTLTWSIHSRRKCLPHSPPTVRRWKSRRLSAEWGAETIASFPDTVMSLSSSRLAPLSPSTATCSTTESLRYSRHRHSGGLNGRRSICPPAPIASERGAQSIKPATICLCGSPVFGMANAIGGRQTPLTFRPLPTLRPFRSTSAARRNADVAGVARQNSNCMRQRKHTHDPLPTVASSAFQRQVTDRSGHRSWLLRDSCCDSPGGTAGNCGRWRYAGRSLFAERRDALATGGAHTLSLPIVGFAGAPR